MYLWQTSFLYTMNSVNVRKRNVCKRNCFTVKNEPKEKREFHFKWISKYKGCGILSFAFKEWMVTFEKRLKTSSKKLKNKIIKKRRNKYADYETFKELKSLFFSKKQIIFLCVSPQNFPPSPVPLLTERWKNSSKQIL